MLVPNSSAENMRCVSSRCTAKPQAASVSCYCPDGGLLEVCLLVTRMAVQSVLMSEP
jgi:hypothetical protein